MAGEFDGQTRAWTRMKTCMHGNVVHFWQLSVDMHIFGTHLPYEYEAECISVHNA